jgi:small subunit ribosomal protein S9
MNKYIYSTGKRKTSIARVFLKEGNGNILINDKNDAEKNTKIINTIKKTLTILNINDKIDLKITVKGGGTTGQTEAIRHGISKALVILDEKNTDEKKSFKKKLKKLGFLTRDSRQVERKKVGKRKARKKEQYSKR